MARLRDMYFNRRVAMMLPLGFASGLPLALTGETLAAWARESGVSLAGSGILSAVSIPYTLKFLWAPLLDRYALPLLDRRRSWILVFQLALIGAIAALSGMNPQNNPLTFGYVAVLIALFSASQDIAIDAYRTDTLSASQRASGTAVFVGGYRLGMILSGGLALVLADGYLSWPHVYLAMGACMGIGVIATLFAEPNASHIAPPPTLADAVIEPLVQLLTRPGGILVILFIILFKLPDVAAGGLTTPFLLDMHIAKTDIGTIRQTIGLAITIVGALAGGAIVASTGLRASLWIFGILQALSNAGFLVLAHHAESYRVLVVVLGIESFCGGLVTAGFTAFLMSQCDRRYSAFQFSLLSSAMAVTRVIGVLPAGLIAQRTGWPTFFLLTIAAGIPGMALLPFVPMRHQPGAEQPDHRTSGRGQSRSNAS